MRLGLLGLVTVAMVGCGDGGGGRGPDDGGPGGDAGETCATPHDYDFPLDYTIDGGVMSIQTAGGPLRVVIGPWGAHTPPHTGHVEGNGKSDWMGLFAATWDDPVMADLSSGTPVPGGCTPEGDCGVSLDDVVSRVPMYVAPGDGFEVTEVVLEYEDPAANEYIRHQWRVEGRLCPYAYTLGHVGSIGADLRQALLDAGYDDPDTFTTPGTLFHDDEHPLVLDAGASLGAPQLSWLEIDGFPGYVRTGAFGTPFAEIEFIGRDYVHAGYTTQAEWNYLSPDRRAVMAEVLATEGHRPNSLRYGQTPDWLWRSEMVLEATEPFPSDEVGGLFARFGGWFEKPDGPCTPWVDPGCDEQFSIFPIHTESEFYDASLYDSPDVRYLVVWRGPTSPGEKFGEVLSPSEPDPISGLLTVKWRYYDDTMIDYQQLAYRVISDPNTLVLRFGTVANSETALPAAPAIPADSSECNGADTLCFSFDNFYAYR